MLLIYDQYCQISEHFDYFIIFDATQRIRNKSLSGTYMLMANNVYYYFKDNVGEDNNWYMYENHKWNLIGYNKYFSAGIEEKLEMIYDKLIEYGNKQK